MVYGEIFGSQVSVVVKENMLFRAAQLHFLLIPAFEESALQAKRNNSKDISVKRPSNLLIE